MSNTKTNSNAAKDDALNTTTAIKWDFTSATYSLNDLLANDAGSAQIVGFTNGVTWDSVANTFTVPAGVTSFNYEIATGHGNGTHSIASVQMAQPSGKELVQNWSFENGPTGQTTGGNYVGFTGPSGLSGWNTVAGSEIVSKGYEGIMGDGHWLDTQASPGAVDISQVISGLNVGQHGQMTFSVAAENIFDYGQSTNPNEKLDFMFDGKLVKEITLADFAKTGGTDFNNFHTFTANIVGGTNNTLQIVSHGSSSNVGFAVDSVSIKALALPTNV